MSKKNVFREKWQSNKTKGGAIPLLGVSVIVFVLTIAVYFVASYVAASLPKENTLSNWEYLYTTRPGATPAGELRIFNAQNPILTEKGVKRENLYLTKTIDPKDSGKTLVILTDYSPVKIKLNGKEIYNNRFDEAYVGNCYNAVKLEPSTHEQQIEVFIKLPLSVRFEAYTNTNSNPAFEWSFGLVFSAAMFALGILGILLLAVLSAIRRKIHRSIAGAAIFSCTGLAVFLNMLPEATYLLNAPLTLRLLLLPVHLTFMATLVCVNNLFRDRRKSAVAVGFASALSVLVMLLAFTPTLLKLSVAAMSVLCLLAALYTLRVAATHLERRTQYATPVFVICGYYTLMITLAGFMLLFRFRALYQYTVAVPTLVVACIMEYIYIADYRYQRKNSKLRENTEGYGATVDNISMFIRNMLKCSDAESFFESAVEEIRALLVKFDPENAELRCCAAVRDGEGYREVISEGVAGCDYRRIEQNATANRKNCVFCETYFEYILKDGDEVGAIFHFENIKNGLDVFFIGMIEATYCGLETTYENTVSRGNQRAINIIFEELAENAELDNGCSVEHLQNISRYTYALCQKLGMSEEESSRIALASKLHDLGKIAVPKYIIHKEGRLSEEERVIVNSHTKFGYTILSAYADDPLISDAATIARYHHEHYDGTGTNALKGEDIPLIARIVTVCDVYDALTSERAYKKAWTPQEAKDNITDNAGKIFDPKLVKLFLTCLEEQRD